MKPILFSTEMIKAILAKRKTQTRRVIKPQPPEDAKLVAEPRLIDNGVDFIDIKDKEDSCLYWTTPKYQIGDIIWVRETHYVYGKWVKNGITKTGKQKYKFIGDYKKPVYFYDTLPTIDKITHAFYKSDIGYFQRPSIFMPYELARIFLKVKNVGCERVQDISDVSAFAEGVGINYTDHGTCRIYKSYDSKAPWYYRVAESFASLWDSINAKRGYDWSTNPWVWVYEFEHMAKYSGGMVGLRGIYEKNLFP